MGKRVRRGRPGHPFYDIGSGHEIVTPDQADFMHRRVGALASFFCASTPLIDLLANAYLWGLQDAVEHQEYMRTLAIPSDTAAKDAGKA